MRFARRRSVAPPVAVVNESGSAVVGYSELPAVAGPEPVELAPESKSRPPTILELLGRKPHPLLSWGIDASDLAWPPPRERKMFVFAGRFYNFERDVVDELVVRDSAVEWQKAHDEETSGWPAAAYGPFGLAGVDWWV